MWSSMEELHPWPATLGGPPTWGCLGSQALLEGFLELSKKVFFLKIPKSTFTIHDDIFQRPVELKIFMWA